MIKNSLVIIFTMFLGFTSLHARVNPFEPTQTFIEEKEALILSLAQVETVVKKEAEDANKTIEIASVVDKKLEKKPEVMKPIEEIIIIKSKIKPEVIKTYKYNLLSFVDLKIRKDIMSLSTKYKLKKYFKIKEENKLVFDFIAKKRFFTQRETISTHKDFKKIVIGAHPEKKYFRVVIQTKEKLSKYNVNIDKNGKVTIKYRVKN